MPSKRSSSFNTKFGFVRFKRREEAINAIEDLDGVVNRNFTIVVQFVKYSKDNPIASQKNFDGVKKIIPAPSIHSLQPKPIEFQSNQRDSISSSYANILKGGSSVIEDPMAETSWEKHVCTSIKIKKENDKEVKEAIVETDPGDDELLDFNVDKAELENEMEILEEVAETNVVAENAIGTEEEALQLINVKMQGCSDKTANSSSRVEISDWGSGRVMDSMRKMAANNTTLNINLDPLTFVRLNTCI
ncbi:hypothetical protein RHMOL_Rhmol01G0373000 [Rhododendron molle]|uniref:Uncharacterized protein n=1 Tax=Rhododendron molle TaxID=49168 RepID=A0ACC0Q9Y6_RHOML|nr:hypothetical protein RHMOL_Rhmol01G0373000 [Rhododendron molle]